MLMQVFSNMTQEMDLKLNTWMPVVHSQYQLGFKQSSLISVMALDGIYNCKMLLFLIAPDSGSESIPEKLFSWLLLTALSNGVYTLPWI